MEIIKTIKVGKHPTVIAIAYDGKKAFVGHSLFVNFSRQKTMKIRVITLDDDEVEANLPTNGFCNSLAVSPDNDLLYAAILRLMSVEF